MVINGNEEFGESSILNFEIDPSRYINLTLENWNFVIQISNHNNISDIKTIIIEPKTDIIF